MWTKNSQPFGKMSENLRGIFFDSHCRVSVDAGSQRTNEWTTWPNSLSLDDCYSVTGVLIYD